MIGSKKLEKVADACEKITAARRAVEDLLDAEPRQQPRTGRAIELQHIAWHLDEQKRQVQELWS